jgi:pyridoxine kinase
MARVLVISSQTVFGPVGLSASVPALQALGHEVMALPTIVLSHHPGHGMPAGQRTAAMLLSEMLQGLERVGALDNVDAVLTGYFADAEQVVVVSQVIAKLKAQHVLVDPVIGDHGALYVPQDVAEGIRDRLLPLATITTPNWFELAWLSGEQDVEGAAAKLGVTETLVTSVAEGQDLLATHLYLPDDHLVIASRRRDHVPHGTGDYLAGLYLAHRLQSKTAMAFAKAMAGLEDVIAASEGQAALMLTTGR